MVTIDNFITPTQFVINQIGKNETLDIFCDSLNTQLNDKNSDFEFDIPQHMITKPFQVGWFEKSLSFDEMNTLKYLYEKFGWDIVFTSTVWENGKVAYNVYLYEKR